MSFRLTFEANVRRLSTFRFCIAFSASMLATHFLSASVLIATHLVIAGILSHICATVKVAGESRNHLMDDSCLLYNRWWSSYWHNRCLDYHTWLRLWMELHLSWRHRGLHRLTLHWLTLVLPSILLRWWAVWRCWGVCDLVVLHLIWYSSIQFIINKLQNQSKYPS